LSTCPVALTLYWATTSPSAGDAVVLDHPYPKKDSLDQMMSELFRAM